MAKHKVNTKLKGLVNSGAELAGGAVGGALGFLAAGPVGAAAGGASGPLVSKALKRIGNELSERILGPREKMRVGATLALAAEEIDERLKKGDNIRSDGFFDKDSSGRSNAEELAESVLLKSQREPEEKKVPFLAHLLVNMAFNKEISVALGEQMLKVAEQLTYRQLCILRLAAVNQKKLELRKTNYREMKRFPRKLYQVLHECYDLYNRNFINVGGTAALGMTDFIPDKMGLEGLGVDIHNWMQLWQIPAEDIEPLIDVLGK